VALFQRSVLFRHIAEDVHLVGRYSAERQLYADHLTIGLSLTVESLPKTESQEFHLIFFASLKQFYLIFEVCDLGTVNLQYMRVFWIWNPVLCIYSSDGHRSDLLSRSIIFTNSIKIANSFRQGRINHALSVRALLRSGYNSNHESWLKDGLIIGVILALL